MNIKQRSVLPGFGLTMGCTMSYLSLMVLIPLAGLFLKSATISWPEFWATVTDPHVVASYKLSFGASLVAATVNAVFGLIVAWTLVRYSFLGKKLVDAMVDLPFAMPTAVSGIALAALYSSHGWIGRWLAPLGIEVAYSKIGVTVALCFIGLPFVVRTLQPALEDMDMEIEEAAASLGATRRQTFVRVILPTILPALLTGFRLGVRPGAGRVRLGRVHLQQVREGHADADLHEAGAISLCRSGGHRRGDAGSVVRRVVVHQFDPMVEPAVRDVKSDGLAIRERNRLR